MNDSSLSRCTHRPRSSLMCHRAITMETSKFEKRRGRVRKKIEALRNGGLQTDATPSPSNSVNEGLDLFPDSPLQPGSGFQLSPDFRYVYIWVWFALFSLRSEFYSSFVFDRFLLLCFSLNYLAKNYNKLVSYCIELLFDLWETIDSIVNEFKQDHLSLIFFLLKQSFFS